MIAVKNAAHFPRSAFVASLRSPINWRRSDGDAYSSRLRLRRHRRVRGKIAGTAERPRLAVFRSNLGISAQLVDDQAGRTLAAAAGSS